MNSAFISKTGVIGFLLLVLSLVSMVLSRAQILTLDFASNTGSSIQFNGSGDSFQFLTGQNGYQWHISSETGGTAALGLNGSFLNGPFSYGSITTSPGGIQTATISSNTPSTLLISDGNGGTLLGVVNFMDITSYPVAFGFLNSQVNVNLTSLAYTGNGTNPDLLTLFADGSGTLDLSFQFATPESLTTLSTGAAPTNTSYSGSIVASAPEPSAWALLLAGLALLAFLRFRTGQTMSGLE